MFACTAAANDAGNFGESTRRSIEQLLRNGLADTSVKSFNSFKSELSLLVSILPTDVKSGYPDPVVARKLVQAAEVASRVGLADASEPFGRVVSPVAVEGEAGEETRQRGGLAIDGD